MADIEQTIIQKVKDKLGIKSENIQVFELYKRLRAERARMHPDLYDNEEAKDTAKEEFIVLSDLYAELNIFIQQQQASMPPVLIADNNEVVEFRHIREIDAKDSEIERLRVDNTSLTYRLRQEQDRVLKLRKQLEELSEQRVELIQNEIKSIYSPRKMWTGVGFVAILTSLLATFPIVREFLSHIGATSSIVLIVLQTLSFVMIVKWLRSWIINYMVDSVECSILNDPFINESLGLRERPIKYQTQEFYFYESDLGRCLRMRLKPYKILFLGGYEKTIKMLTEDLIIQLDRKKLINRTESDGLRKVFIVLKKVDSSDVISF